MRGRPFSRKWHGKADGRITTMMAPHAPYTCPPAFIKRMGEEAEKLGLPVHIHMSETAKEVRLNEQQYGKRPVEHLADIGLFDRPTLVAHAVHLEEYEIDLLREKDVKISHNPASNLKLGSGVAPVPRLLEKGMHISVGTDSVASNNNLDMFQEVRLAALIHKGATQDATVVPAETALKMGTAWGAEGLFLNDVGELSPGYKADFITIQPQQAHLQPVSDPVSHIIYSASGHDVEDVYVDGRSIVQNGQCTRLDEEQIRFEAARAYKQIMQA
jgi:5-methylthioadenosine/S-adenosylhomocysteine deaminase